MNLLLCGDVVGKSGREIVLQSVPMLRERLALDFVVANGENAAHGFGITADICQALFEAGVDVITTGNHVWDKRDIVDFIAADIRLLRPLNYPEGTPGWGASIYSLADGRRVMVAQVMGRLFMDPLDDPFRAIDVALLNHHLGNSVDAIIVDVHAEATSEKMSMAHHLDGRVTLVAGTHTHVPAADARVLAGGTAYITDVGMCGDYDSVIGMEKAESMARFTRKMSGGRLQPANGPATLCAVYVETDDATGRATRIAPVRIGGCLATSWPD